MITEPNHTVGVLGRTGVPDAVVRWLDTDEHALWDQFVATHHHGLIYHTTAWRRAIEQAFPHISGRFLVICDNNTGQVKAGIPVYVVRSWLLGNRIVSVPYASVSDPLISTVDELDQLMPSVRDLRAKTGARTIEIRTRSVTPFCRTYGLTPTSVYKHHLLPLDRSPQALFRTFAKTSVCQKISKAEKAAVTIAESDGGDLRIVYDILCHTRRRLNLPLMPFAFFQALTNSLWPHNMKMFIARHRGRPVGCHVVLISSGVWISEFSGNTDGAASGVNQLLYWDTIQRACSSGAIAFSFGRTAASNAGLLEYKRRWAPIEEDVTYFGDTRGTGTVPVSNREGTLHYRVIRSILSRSPLPVCKAIGHFCYRHLG
jgi:hypothetical protein